jgi:hypothetical protein
MAIFLWLSYGFPMLFPLKKAPRFSSPQVAVVAIGQGAGGGE